MSADPFDRDADGPHLAPEPQGPGWVIVAAIVAALTLALAWLIDGLWVG